jgi:ABC-type branched-subunit amino acid transport system substrate-binding protein
VNRRNLIVLLALASAACQKEPYRIGVWTGGTGSNVAKMVEHEVNFKGGVAGRQLGVRLVAQRALARDSLTPQMLAASLDSMAQDASVLAVVTRMTDSVTEGAARRFEQQTLPYLVTTPVDESYAEKHPHAFLLAPSVQSEAQFLVQQSLKGKRPDRVGIMWVREPHAEAQMNAIVAELGKRGITPTLNLSFRQDADEYNMTAKGNEMAASKPEVLYFVGRSPSFMLVHGVIRNSVHDVQIYGSSLVESWHVYENPSRMYTGLHFVRYADPNSSDTAMVRLRDRLTMWIGRNELNTEELIALDAERAIAAAIKDSATTRPAVLEQLRTKSFPGLAGPVRFGPGQRVQRPLYLAEVGRDSVRVIARSDTLIAKK